MKNKIFSLLFTLAAVFALTGCDDWEPAQQKFAANTGGVNLGDLNVNVKEATSRAGIDTSGYLVTIYNTDGTVASYDGKECSWTYSQMPEVMTLAVGSYTVDVRSHAVKKAEWDKPYYKGSAKFEVENNKITDIGTVTCTFASARVEVKFTEDLRNAMGADCKVDVVANDEGLLSWTANDEGRRGYFEVIDGSMTLAATFSGTISGQSVVVKKVFTDVNEGKCYVITFSLKKGSDIPDETGGVTPGGITVDGEIFEEEQGTDVPGDDPGDIGGSGRPDDEDWPDEPTPPGPGPDEPGDEPFTVTCETMPDFDKYYPINLPSYELHIVSEKPLAHLNVEIISDYLTNEFLTGVGLSSSFDLAEPGDLETALAGFSFPVKDGVVGQTDVNFNLTPFIPLLELGLSNDPPVTRHSFKLTIIDNENNQKTIELKFDATLK